MNVSISEDIHSITDLKKNTASIIKKVKSTGRPTILTVNGKAEAVLLDAREYQKIISS